jgi:hypothetical protein
MRQKESSATDFTRVSSVGNASVSMKQPIYLWFSPILTGGQKAYRLPYKQQAADS